MLTKTIVTVALAGGLAFGIAVPAQAASALECSMERVLVSPQVEAEPAVYGPGPLLTPAQEAWIERVLVSPAVAEVSRIVHHEAVYAPRIVIDRPFLAAVPAVEEVSHIVRHPAVAQTVHHEAVTKQVPRDAVTKVVKHEAVIRTEHTRYSWVGGGKGPAAGNTPETSPQDWNADNKKYDGSTTGVVLQQGKGNGSYFYWAAREVVEQAAFDEIVVVTPASTETVVVTPAWDENIVTPAWEEKIIVVEGRPGTPEQAEISHVEYDLVSEAWDEKVVDVPAQDAVYADVVRPAQPAVFGEPVLISAAVAAVPAVYEDVETCAPIATPAVAPAVVAPVVAPAPLPIELPLTSDGPAESAGLSNAAAFAGVPAELALTGGGIAPFLPVAAGALVVAGGVALMATRRSRRGEH